MRAHVTGLILLVLCGTLLAVDTRLFLAGEYAAVVTLTAVFLGVVLILAVLIAVVPSIAAAVS